MYKLLTFTIVAVLLWLAACTEEPDMRVESLPMVIEGWIEEGESPVVIVSHALDLTADTVSFDDAVEKWGRVSIFDGEERIILNGRINHDYVPPFIFTSSRLKGEAGHSYRLLVETESDTVEATASILHCPRLMPLVPVKKEGVDSLYTIKAFVEDIDEDGYYKFFIMREGVESRFFSSFMGTFKGSDYDASEGATVSVGKHSAYSGQPTEHYFKSGETVTVKLCSMEKEVYEFWKAYDEQVSLSDNLFFTFDKFQPTNIEGGVGYWGAYGNSVRSVKIP